MTEMVAAEPAVAERIARRLASGSGGHAVGAVAGMVHDAVRRGRPVVTTGCGTSEHAAIAAAWLLADALEPAEGWRVQARQALDVLRRPVAEGALVAVSHEGGTWATNAALGAVRPEHVTRALISVSDRSPGAGLAEVVIQTYEQDQSWCHTVGYLSPLVAAATVAQRLRDEPLDAASVRGLLEAAGGQEQGAEEVAAAFSGVDRIVTVGTAQDEPAARELALKIEEGAGLPARALQLETIRHGHLAACDERTGLILLLTDAEPAGDPVRDRARAVLRAAAALGMPASAIFAPRVGATIPRDLTPAGRLDAPEANQLRPAVEAILSTAIPLQLVAERLARARGRNPDPIGRDDPRQAAAGEA